MPLLLHLGYSEGQPRGTFLGTMMVYLPHNKELLLPFPARKCDSKTDFLKPYLGIGFDMVPQQGFWSKMAQKFPFYLQNEERKRKNGRQSIFEEISAIQDLLFLLLLCNTKRLDGVYIIVVKIANLELRIFLQMLVDVHFFSFSPHSTSKKETFEPFWTKIPIGEPCQNQDPNMGLKICIFGGFC